MEEMESQTKILIQLYNNIHSALSEMCEQIDTNTQLFALDFKGIQSKEALNSFQSSNLVINKHKQVTRRLERQVVVLSQATKIVAKIVRENKSLKEANKQLQRQNKENGVKLSQLSKLSQRLKVA